jgi:hypothetical protein
MSKRLSGRSSAMDCLAIWDKNTVRVGRFAWVSIDAAGGATPG